MTILSTFMQTQLLKAIEAEFLAHEPEIQAVILHEVTLFSQKAAQWVNTKLQEKLQEKKP